jgi:ABC-type phosphate transport system ATPase subunit
MDSHWVNLDLGVAQPIEAGRRLFQNPSKQKTEDYITGRFG